MIVRLCNLSIRTPQRSDLKAIVELMTTCDVAQPMRHEELEEEVRSAWQSEAFHLESDAWIIVNYRAQSSAMPMSARSAKEASWQPSTFTPSTVDEALEHCCFG